MRKQNQHLYHHSLGCAVGSEAAIHSLKQHRISVVILTAIRADAELM